MTFLKSVLTDATFWTAFAAIFAAVSAWLSYRSSMEARRAAHEANETAGRMLQIEHQRRSDEAAPRFKVECRELNRGNKSHLSIRFRLVGPPGLDEIRRLEVSVRPNPETIRGQDYFPNTWSLYHFFPRQTHEGIEIVDEVGQTLTVEGPMSIGDSIKGQLTLNNPPGPLATNPTGRSWTPDEWSTHVGDRLWFEARVTHAAYGPWRYVFDFCSADVGGDWGQVAEFR